MTLFFTSPLFADRTQLASALTSRGIVYELNDQKLIITIDETKAIETIPELQKKGVLPKDVTQKDIAAKPVTAAVEAVGMNFTFVLVRAAFQNDPSLNQLHVEAFFVPANAGIFSRDKPCFSFDFDRATYDKINWTKINSKDFIDLTTNFAYQQWCTDQLVQEAKH